MIDPAPINLTDVNYVINNHRILKNINWTVNANERWAILGLNGCGKTSLLKIAGLYLHPSSGKVDVLGNQLGSCDVRSVRKRIGFSSQSISDLLRPNIKVRDAVVTGLNAALETWWHTYDENNFDKASELINFVGLSDKIDRQLNTLSAGERQRALLARTLVTDPEILLLDEPTAGLDFLGREELIETLTQISRKQSELPIVLVTHHTEEIPPDFTHTMMMKQGEIICQGPIAKTLNSENLSNCYDTKVQLEQVDSRWRTY